MVNERWEEGRCRSRASDRAKKDKERIKEEGRVKEKEEKRGPSPPHPRGWESSVGKCSHARQFEEEMPSITIRSGVPLKPP